VPGGSHPTSNLNEAPSRDLTPNIDNETPKMTGATWKRSSKGGIGEAGDFVENRSRGGIMELKPDGTGVFFLLLSLSQIHD